MAPRATLPGAFDHATADPFAPPPAQHGDASASPTAPQVELSEFDAAEFLLSLEAGEYQMSHTLASWTLGDLERLDSLLFEQHLGLPNLG